MPLDSSYPRERLRYMLQDSGPTLLLLQGAGRSALGQALMVPSVDLDADEALWHGHPSVNRRPDGAATDHLAYIIYTSGSTGQPKGVMNEHRAVVNRLHWMHGDALNDRIGATENTFQLRRIGVGFGGSSMEPAWLARPRTQGSILPG